MPVLTTIKRPGRFDATTLAVFTSKFLLDMSREDRINVAIALLTGDPNPRIADIFTTAILNVEQRVLDELVSCNILGEDGE